MKAISKRQHRAIIANLQQLEDLRRAGLPNVNRSLPVGGFTQHIQSLSER